MIPIFLSSWNRLTFTKQVLRSIRERTEPDSYSLHVYDNGSEPDTQAFLCSKLEEREITSLHLDSRNTGCLFNKLVYHSMVPDDVDIYCVTDNDFIPCIGWLPAMLKVMASNPDLALLTLDYYPRWPLQPMNDRGDYMACQAVGNTYKLCRRQAVEQVIHDIPQKMGAYGDDGLLCELLRKVGWEVGYIKGKYCFNLELTQYNWGYTEDQLKQDPRKAGYSEPIRYFPLDWETLIPPPAFQNG